TIYSLVFLFLHELAHVRLGHIEYRTAEAARLGSLSSATYTSLEYMADADAMILGALVVNAAYATRTRRDKDDKPVAKLQLGELRLYGFAIALVFLLGECFDAASTAHFAHPPAAARSLLAR